MIKKYNQFIKESLVDQMVAKSNDEIRKSFSHSNVAVQLNLIKRYKLDDSFLPTDEEIAEYMSGLSIFDQLELIKLHDLDSKFMPSDEEIKEYLSSLPVMKWKKYINYFNLDDSFSPSTREIKKAAFDEKNIKDFYKSFNRKATLIPSEDKNKIQLKSYNTIVAEYNFKTKKLKVNDWYSSTTQRQINGFIDYLGGSRLSKKEMLKRPTITL